MDAESKPTHLFIVVVEKGKPTLTAWPIAEIAPDGCVRLETGGGFSRGPIDPVMFTATGAVGQYLKNGKPTELQREQIKAALRKTKPETKA